jgi:hypothetical protein
LAIPDSPTPSRYQWQIKGVPFDFYRLCEAIGIVHHAQANALKTRSGQMKGLEGALGDASAVRRDMEKQQKELRDRQAADARAAKLAADRNRDRMLQYPRAPGTD